MRNLLSIEYRKLLWREYITRFAGFASLILSGMVAANALLLWPALVVLQDQNRSLEEHITVKSVVSAGGGGEVFAKITEISNGLERMLKYEEMSFLSTQAALTELLAHLPKGIFLYSISINRGNGKDITVRGTARTREGLVAFVDALDRSSRFTGATLPVTQFAQRENIDFSLTFTHVSL
jgi:Tfp pilus assembly protein PilN